MVTTTVYGATERQVATGKDTLRLTLRDAVELAQRQSPSVQSARNAYLAAKWNYRYHLANYLPSVTPLVLALYKQGGEQNHAIRRYGSLPETKPARQRRGIKD